VIISVLLYSKDCLIFSGHHNLGVLGRHLLTDGSICSPIYFRKIEHSEGDGLFFDDVIPVLFSILMK
jgi:hypothetical protein